MLRGHLAHSVGGKVPAAAWLRPFAVVDGRRIGSGGFPARCGGPRSSGQFLATAILLFRPPLLCEKTARLTSVSPLSRVRKLRD